MSGFDHKEAFCLMQYASDCGHYRELLWNSRDGVTSFAISSRGGAEIKHVYFGSDHCAPEHIPDVGDRIFIDATLDDFRESIRRRLWGYVDRDCNPSGDLVRRYGGMSVDQIVELIAADEFGRHENQPHVEIVTPSLRGQLALNAPERLAEALLKGFVPKPKRTG